VGVDSNTIATGNAEACDFPDAQSKFIRGIFSAYTGAELMSFVVESDSDHRREETIHQASVPELEEVEFARDQYR